MCVAAVTQDMQSNPLSGHLCPSYLQCQDESCSSCQADFRKCTQCFTDSDPMPYLANGKCLMVSRVHRFCARLSLAPGNCTSCTVPWLGQQALIDLLAAHHRRRPAKTCTATIVQVHSLGLPHNTLPTPCPQCNLPGCTECQVLPGGFVCKQCMDGYAPVNPNKFGLFTACSKLIPVSPAATLVALWFIYHTPLLPLPCSSQLPSHLPNPAKSARE